MCPTQICFFSYLKLKLIAQEQYYTWKWLVCWMDFASFDHISSGFQILSNYKVGFWKGNIINEEKIDWLLGIPVK